LLNRVYEADEARDMNKIILADSQAIFRAGTAKVLAMDEDLGSLLNALIWIECTMPSRPFPAPSFCLRPRSGRI
jgi:hypothetical protein